MIYRIRVSVHGQVLEYFKVYEVLFPGKQDQEFWLPNESYPIGACGDAGQKELLVT